MDPFCKGIAGEIVEVRMCGGELCLDWTIPQILHLSDGGGDYYDSPRFGFCGAVWHLRVWPNWFSSGELSFFLWRDDDAGPSTRTLCVSSGRKGSGGGIEMKSELQRSFRKGDCCDLGGISRRGQTPGDPLTILCVMRIPGTTVRDASTQTKDEVKETRVSVDDKQYLEKRGVEKVAEDMGKLLDSGKRCDITVQVQQAEFRVHSSVLSARSPVLSAMLEHDTAERASHRINIDDCEADVFREYLRYLYTGSVKSLSGRTVFGLYRVADQYLADDLKLMCLEHIRDTLCVETFCDTVTLAMTHGESDLLRLALDFAAENIQPILRSVEWQNFICEHPREANEILIQSVRPQS